LIHLSNESENMGCREGNKRYIYKTSKKIARSNERETRGMGKGETFKQRNGMNEKKKSSKDARKGGVQNDDDLQKSP